MFEEFLKAIDSAAQSWERMVFQAGRFGTPPYHLEHGAGPDRLRVSSIDCHDNKPERMRPIFIDTIVAAIRRPSSLHTSSARHGRRTGTISSSIFATWNERRGYLEDFLKIPDSPAREISLSALVG